MYDENSESLRESSAFQHSGVVTPMEEAMARELCDTYYLTVDPKRPMSDAFDKISEKTRNHWRAQAILLRMLGWRK